MLFKSLYLVALRNGINDGKITQIILMLMPAMVVRFASLHLLTFCNVHRKISGMHLKQNIAAVFLCKTTGCDAF